MANVLPMGTRVRIVGALTEGNSIRATARLESVDKNAVLRLAIKVGDGCERLHNRLVRGVAAYVVQCDETWSFISKKAARCEPGKDPEEWGDAYTFIGLCSRSKLVISYVVGKRDDASTTAFIDDLRARLCVVPHLSTDGFGCYVPAVGASFAGSGVDYGQVVKQYRTGSRRGPDHRYEPPRDPFITKTPVFGVPDEKLMSTSHVERFNLTMRQTVGRTRRLCLAFSKTLRGHRAGVALGIAAYNFCRIHSTIGMTPAMAAGITDHPWTIGELVEAALAELESEPVPAPEPQPLRMPEERATRTTRELPNGRGFLRVVEGGQSSPKPSAPTHAPTPLRAAPRQLSLFDGLDDDS